MGQVVERSAALSVQLLHSHSPHIAMHFGSIPPVTAIIITLIDSYVFHCPCSSVHYHFAISYPCSLTQL